MVLVLVVIAIVIEMVIVMRVELVVPFALSLPPPPKSQATNSSPSKRHTASPRRFRNELPTRLRGGERAGAPRRPLAARQAPSCCPSRLCRAGRPPTTRRGRRDRSFASAAAAGVVARRMEAQPRGGTREG